MLFPILLRNLRLVFDHRRGFEVGLDVFYDKEIAKRKFQRKLLHQ